MKALLVLALLTVTSFANAAVQPGAAAAGISKPTVGAALLNKQAIVDTIVSNVGFFGKILVGVSNATNQLGSTTFSLTTTSRSHQRIELRAALRVNQQGRTFDYGVSSNPEAYHMDVNVVAAGSNSQGQDVRLQFRPKLTHTTPAAVATRILIYDASVVGLAGSGRLVATVQQRAVPEQRVWKTTATYLKFVPN